ncbi:WD repeat-containing protein on Y chromosome-like [Sphaeramia orbicularis]|uniref:WD repeat-containing protein on Y chromosome-like n=1 Tax=Sphaeramia orbicularis TaxID=375764 RepID=UPI00117D8EF9|nr:WD repeat-containing protein on Y chromosome-like [Sphaeramia orbicularis]
MATKEKQWWDPYETSQRRDFTYRPNSSAELLLCPTSTSFIDSFSQSRPFGSSVYHEDFNWKPACKPECIRTGTASGQRRNNPHPSKSFMMWRLPRDATRSSEYVSFPWKCSPSEGEICKALTAQYRSTYRCDFMGMPQEKRLVPPCSRRRVPTSTDTEMRDSYRQPKQRPEVNHCHYSCNMNRRTACRGIVPSVVQRHVLTQQKDSDLTTYDRFCGNRAANVSNLIKSPLPQELQHMQRILPEQEKEAVKPALIRGSNPNSRNKEFETSGFRSIDVKMFSCVIKRCLGLPNASDMQIKGLFKKIDYSDQGRISWSDFCTHMLQEHKEMEETVRRSKQVAFTLPATMKALCHGVPVVNIHSTHDGTIITVCEDGAVCYWSPELKPQKTKHMFIEGPANRKSKWASDFTVMTENNKLLIGTGDREIQLYELSTLEPYCQINALETVPLTLDCGYTDPDTCCILYGDTEGCVNIILISSVGDTLRLWNKLPRTENIPTIAIDNIVFCTNVTFVRWKVHQDWVTQARYFQSFRAVVSSSNEDVSSVVIGCVLPLTDAEQQLNEIRDACYEGKIKKIQLNWTPQLRASSDQTVFSVYKGVKTFDLCRKHSLLVTGGMDGLVRLWNPCFSGKPIGILKGHPAPIVYICISSEDSRIFSVSIDGTVKIWDIQDQCCLFTADPKASGIHGDISVCSYSLAMKSLYIAADSLAVLSLKIRPRLHTRLTVSHNEPVMCCGYSEEFRQVVSCTQGSVVRVWEFDSGRQVFEFGGTPDLSAITCMTFDPKGRRLITGSRDGCLKIWNFNSGQCLKTLKKDGEYHEVCDCIFLKVHRNSYVMSVGRDRRIDIYSDIPEDLHHVQRPQPSWQDDLKNGHKDDILCTAQCPPSLLATGSYDGEIIVWNVVSGRIQCRFVSPPQDGHQNAEGLDTSVPSIIFMKNSKLQQISAANTLLLSSGAKGFINLWSVLGGGKLVRSFKASRSQQKITKLAKTEKDSLLYSADRTGYIYIYNINKLTPSPEQKNPRPETFWRAHTSKVTGLHIVDNDQVVLTSSTDCTVRLWSAHGEFIGTFGQLETWNVHISSSWQHPGVPYEILVDPLSMPDHEILNIKTHLSDAVSADNIEADRDKIKALLL